jgi:hypothetical protein
MKPARIVQCFSLLFAFACICVSAAQADIDQKLVGYWLFKMSPVANWSVWHIADKGKTNIQYIGGDDNPVVLQSEDHAIRKQNSKDSKEDMIFAMKGDDEVLLSSQGGLGMMVRIPEDRWKAMCDADSAASFPEYSDPRFALLNDKTQVIGLLANTDPALVGTWIFAGPNGVRGIWHFNDGGSVEMRPFATDQSFKFFVVRHGNELVAVPDGTASVMFNLTYKIVTPDELVLSDQHGQGPTVLMRLPNERESELFKLEPGALKQAPEMVKVADEYIKVAGSAAPAN